MLRRFFLVVFTLIAVAFHAQINPDFSVNRTTVCAPQSVSFIYTGEIDADTYFWEFSNGQASSLKNPRIIFNTPALISVQLKVVKNGVEEVVEKNNFVRVFAPPIVDFQVNNPIGCAPLQVNFTDLSQAQSGALTNWFWSFGDGESSTLQYPTKTYTEAGKYDVLLKVKDQNACETTVIKSNYITLGGPKADFLFNDFHCQLPVSLNFINTSTGNNLSYFWDFGNGVTSINELPGTIQYIYFDTTEVVLAVKEAQSNCVDTVHKKLTISNYKALFDYVITCNHPNYTFALQEKSLPSPTQIRWDFTDGTLSTQKNVTKTFTNNINRNSVGINLRVELNASCWDTVSLRYQPPIASTTYFSRECTRPMIVDFTNLSKGKDLSYYWDFGDSTFSNIINPVKEFSTPPDRFFVQQTVTDAYNCSHTRAYNVRAPFPRADFETTDGSTSGCAPLQLSFMDTLSYIMDSTKIVAVYWDFGDEASGSLNFSTDTTPTHVYQTPGVYTVKYAILLDNGCLDTLIKENYIKVGQKPDSILINSDLGDTICFGSRVNYSAKNYLNGALFESDFFCWSFEQTSGMPLLLDSNQAPSSCPPPQNQNQINPRALHLNFPQPTHDYLNYDYQFQSQINQKNVFAQAQGEAGNRFTHLITGYNGCYAEQIVSKYIHPTIAMPGFVFPDSVGLYLSDTSKLLGVFNASDSFTEVEQFRWGRNNPFVELGQISFTDTTYIQFPDPGMYRINIKVTDSLSNCSHETNRIVRVDQPQLAIQFENNLCFSNKKFYAIDRSSFLYGGTYQRAWYVNDSLIRKELNIAPPRKDSVLLSILDTGWNKVRLEITRQVPFDLYALPLQSRLYTFTLQDSVYINGSITEAFVDTNFVCKGDSLLFQHQSVSTSSIDSLVWQYDALMQNNTQAAHYFQFTSSKDWFPKVLTYSSAGCVDTFLLDSIHVSGPVVNFVANDTLICIGEEVNFTNLSVGNNLSYHWLTPNEEYFNIDVTHQYDFSDSMEVKLIATDIFGCKDSLIKAHYIYVASFPEPQFSTDTNFALCPPFTLQLADSSQGTHTRKWFLGDGNTASASSVNHTYIHPGFYSITLQLTNFANCTASLTKDSVLEIQGPQGNVDLLTNAVCLPQATVFQGDFSKLDYYVWDFADGSIQSFLQSEQGDTVHYHYKKGGSYTTNVLLVDSNECAYRLPQVYTVKTDSVWAKIDVDTLWCDLIARTFTNQGKITYPASIVWDFGDGAQSNNSAPNYVYTQEGLYTVRLNLVSEIGCVGKDSVFIQSYRYPEFDFVVTHPDFCVPRVSEIHLQLQEEDFPWEELNLIHQNQAKGSAFTLQRNQAGTENVNVFIVYGNSNCKVDSIIQLNYYNTAIADFNFTPKRNSVESPEVQFTNQSKHVTQFLWDFSNGNISTQANPTQVFSSPGVYPVSLIGSNLGGCADTVTKNISIATSDYVRLPNAFTPNGDGLDDVFSVIYAGDIQIISLKIFNRWGALIHEDFGNTAQWDGNVAGRLQAEGTYVYVLKAMDQSGLEFELKGELNLLR